MTSHYSDHWDFLLTAVQTDTVAPVPGSVEDVQNLLRDQAYITDRGLAIAIFLALKLQRPLFLEGEAGVGKTEIARAWPPDSTPT